MHDAASSNISNYNVHCGAPNSTAAARKFHEGNKDGVLLSHLRCAVPTPTPARVANNQGGSVTKSSARGRTDVPRRLRDRASACVDPAG